MNWLRGIMLGAAATAIVLFGFGFWSFAAGVRAMAPPRPVPEVDAIVSLTGGGAQRLQTGLELLAEGRGRRLLITGVNAQVTDAELIALLDAPEPLFDCCVDVGRSAENTLGNAAETAAWAQRNGFDELIVVTADYHMPRSLAELRIALPEATLIPYPVKSKTADERTWQGSLGGAARMVSEYVKLLVVTAREHAITRERKDATDAGAATA